MLSEEILVTILPCQSQPEDPPTATTHTVMEATAMGTATATAATVMAMATATVMAMATATIMAMATVAVVIIILVKIIMAIIPPNTVVADFLEATLSLKDHIQEVTLGNCLN